VSERIGVLPEGPARAAARLLLAQAARRLARRRASHVRSSHLSVAVIATESSSTARP
jgi:hypothetical protein